MGKKDVAVVFTCEGSESVVHIAKIRQRSFDVVKQFRLLLADEDVR